MTGAALVVEGLSVAFTGLHALDRVDLSVPAGSLSALVGPNGAGKSTLLNAIGGFVHAVAGSIRLDGRELRGLSPHHVAGAGVGRAFQFVELGETRRVDELVGRFRLAVTGDADESAHLGSGGRSLSRAGDELRALVFEPKLPAR